MASEMTQYIANGQEIYVKEEGNAKRPVALMIHGWSSSWYAMSPLIPGLSKRYRCVAVDLPGYGESPRPSEKITIEGYADILADLLRQITNRPAILIGHSMGGMISITLALKYPDLVERMVLLCPTISGQLSLFINLFISPITVLETFPFTGWLVSMIEPHMFGVTDRLMRPASFAEHSLVSKEDYDHLRADARRREQGRVRAECFWAMQDGDLRGRLNKITTPSLVIWGMEDNTVPLKDASVLSEEWPEADLRILPSSSHWPQFECPAITQRHITAFLSTPMKLLNFDKLLLLT